MAEGWGGGSYADCPLTKLAAGFMSATSHPARGAVAKGRGGGSYADFHAAALTKRQNATLLTGDLEFKQMNNEITIEWLAE